MFSDYLVLIVFVISFVLVLLLLWMSFNLLPIWDYGIEDDAEDIRKQRIRVLVSIGVLFIAFVCVSYVAGQHLVMHAPQVMEQFGLWYGFGFLSRMVLLYHRRELLDRYSGTDYGAVAFAFLVATLGLIETALLVKRVYFEQNWFDR